MYSLRELRNRKFMLSELGPRVANLNPVVVSQALDLAASWRRDQLTRSYHRH